MNKTTDKTTEKFLVIDGSSLLHRAFYALPLLSNAQGEFTNGVYGFMTMLNKMLSEQTPDYLVVCFDKSRVTFRTAIYADYKGTRKETPLELRGQFELLKEVLTAAGISWLEQEGFEADDLIGTYAREAAESGRAAWLLSGDADLLQLIDEQTVVYLTKKGITKIDRWDQEAVRAEYDLTPHQLIDLKALMGDSSDNIPGVPGVGKKTALQLMQQFGSVAGLYEHLEEVKAPKLRQKLDEHRDTVAICQKLAAIDRHAPVEADWEQLRYQGMNSEQLLPLYQRLEFKNLLKTLTVPSDETPATAAAAAEITLLDDLGQLQELAAQIKADGRVSVYATWQEHPFKGELTALGWALADGSLVAADLLWQREAKLAILAPLLADGAVQVTTANTKELAELLAHHGYALASSADDVVLAAYLLDPAASEYAVAELAGQAGLPVPAAEFDPVREAARLASLLEPLRAQQAERMAEAAMEPLYREVELPLARVLAQLEQAGIKVEGEQLRLMSDELAKEIARLTAEIYELAGQEFNINSTKQLGFILFEKLGIPPLKKTKTGYSTNAEVLEQLAVSYPIAAKIQEYRVYTKLRSTYTDGLWPLIDPVDGKIHTTFTQTVTTTGRLSSVNPNLQNIPVRMEQGRKIRRVFVADAPDHWLLAADYNQIELRILAHISGDQKLIEAFRSGEDIHARTAAEVFDLPLAEVSRELRRQAKAVNFGIVYGISDYGLGRDLGISRQQAKEYITKYFARYPQVEQYQQQTIRQGEADGYVSTLLGRRRYLPDLNNRNFNLRSFAQRMAINMPIQGSAADIIKIAMIRMAARMQELQLHSRMILQVHDELIFDVPETELAVMTNLVKEVMQSAMTLDIPLTVDVKRGPDWYNMEKMK